MKFLIVDDNNQNIYMLQTLLDGHGNKVVSASNGVEALEKARNIPPDIIISDIMMPVMDGFTLCYEWKKDNTLSEIPFIFYTATYTDDRDEDLAIKLGADKFIRKPVEPDEFIAIIQKVFENTKQNGTALNKPHIDTEKDIFRLYNERLILKLENKMLELENEILEHKRTETALQKSEEKYRTLFSLTNEGVALHEIIYGDSDEPIDYRILDVNPAYESITGIKKIDAVEKLASQLYERDDAPYLDIYAKVVSSGISTTFETTFEPMEKSFKISVFQTGTGRFATLFADITERKKNEEAVQKAHGELEIRVLERTEELELLNKYLRNEVSERKRAEKQVAIYQKFTDSSPQGLGMSDLNGYIIYANSTLSRFLGRDKPEDAYQTNVKDYYLKEDLPRLENEILPAVIEKGHQTIEMPIVSVDGKITPALQSIFLIHDEHNNPLFLAKVVTDISDLKQMEEELRIHRDHLEELVSERTIDLRKSNKELQKEIEKSQKIAEALQESEERFKRLSYASFEGIAITEKGFMIDVNKQLASMLGYELNEMIGIEVEKLIAPEDRDLVFNKIKAENDKPYEHKALRKDGSIITVEAHGQTAFYKSKQVRLTAIRDVTQHKKLEEQLRQAQKMEAIGQLAGGIAHDFNNFLTAIIGFASIIKMKTEENSSLMSHIDHIITSANKAAYLTRSLLAFSRKQIINLKPIRVNENIQNLFKFLIRILGEDIELKTSLTELNPQVMADSIQIDQVLINLVTNARDAMPNGGEFNITTDCIQMDTKFIKEHGIGKQGMYVLISLTDTGIGMDEETKNKIFEPFFTTKEVGEGTGLGMSVLYGLIKQHKGFIVVQSEPGKGTTFEIYFPMIIADVEKVTTEKIVTLMRGTETILVAEDEEMARKLAKTLLEEFGYTVIEAINGVEAVEKFIENKDSIELLLLDVIMPKKNGKKVLDEIMEIKPEIKAIFTSGYPKDIINKKGILDEGLNFISKPISPHDLLIKVRDVLDNQISPKVS